MGFFQYVNCFNLGPYFNRGADFFFPEETRTDELNAVLIQQRDILFNHIRGIYEAFANGFIDNYITDEAQIDSLRAFFKDQYLFPFSEPHERFATAHPFRFSDRD